MVTIRQGFSFCSLGAELLDSEKLRAQMASRERPRPDRLSRVALIDATAASGALRPTRAETGEPIRAGPSFATTRQASANDPRAARRIVDGDRHAMTDR